MKRFFGLIAMALHVMAAHASEPILVMDRSSGLCAIQPPVGHGVLGHRTGVRAEDLFTLSRVNSTYDQLVRKYLETSTPVAEALVYRENGRDPNANVDHWIDCDTQSKILEGLKYEVYNKDQNQGPCDRAQEGFSAVIDLAPTIDSASERLGAPSLQRISKPIQVADGGTDGHGGDVIPSTPDQVLAAGNRIQEKLAKMWNRILWVHSTLAKNSFDQKFGKGSYDLIERLSKGTKKSGPFLDAVKSEKIEFEWKRNGACIGDHEFKDGSATGENGQGKICLSVSRLQSNAPESLETELMAIGSHELSHLFGFDEKSAKEIQTFVRDHGTVTVLSKDIQDSLEQRKKRTFESLTEVLDLSIKHASDEEICAALGRLSAVAESYTHTIASNKVDFPSDLPVGALMEDSLVRASLGYCGDQRPPRLPFEREMHVKKGDRDALSANLLLYYNDFVRSAVRVAAFIDIDQPAKGYLPYRGSFLPFELAAKKDTSPEDIRCDLQQAMKRTSTQMDEKDLIPKIADSSKDTQVLFVPGITNLILFKFKGERAVRLSIMDRNATNFKNDNGVLTVDADERSVIQTSGLGYGGVESVKFEYDTQYPTINGGQAAFHNVVRCQLVKAKSAQK